MNLDYVVGLGISLLVASTLLCAGCGSQSQRDATPVAPLVVTLHASRPSQLVDLQLPADSKINCVNHNQKATETVPPRSTWKAGVDYGWSTSTASGELNGKQYSATLMVRPVRQGAVLVVRCTT